jgi:TadE-like protein
MGPVQRLHRRSGGGSRGQAMVELALVFPLFVMVFFGIIVLGIGVFYQQQITNAAREAARFASIHSATSSKPTVSWLNPTSQPLTYNRYDQPENSWPYMTAAGRQLIFGLDPTAVNVAACWSGYRINVAGQPVGAYDAPPPLGPPGYAVIGPVDSGFAQCTIDGADPTSNPTGIGCTSTLASTTVDQASDLSEGQGRIVANTVTAYACYLWSPPLAGFLLIPQTVTLRAVITEPIERQQ